MAEVLSFFTRAAVCLVYLIWAGRWLTARFARKRAAAAYGVVFLLWTGVDGMLLRLIALAALPHRWAGAVFLMALADGLLFLGAMAVLFRKEEPSLGGGRREKAWMAAACFRGNALAKGERTEAFRTSVHAGGDGNSGKRIEYQIISGEKGVSWKRKPSGADGLQDCGGAFQAGAGDRIHARSGGSGHEAAACQMCG